MSRIGNAAATLIRMTVLIQKRLIKSPAFLAVLALILLFAVLIGQLSTNGGGGLVRVGFLAPSGDKALEQIAKQLEEQKELMVCTRYQDEKELLSAVEEGREDAAWVFYPDYTDRCRAFLDEGRAVVRCYEKESGTALNLAREKMFSYLFDQVSRDIFAGRMEELSGVKPTDDEIARYYEQDVKSDHLIVFYDLDDRLMNEESVVLSPLRGLLSLLVLCGGMAAAVTLALDEKRGVFTVLPGKRAAAFRVLSVFYPLIDLSVVMYAALAALGLLTDPAYEILLCLCAVIAQAGLCDFLLNLLRRPLPVALSLLPLIFLTLSAAPVFLNVRALRGIGYLLPGYW